MSKKKRSRRRKTKKKTPFYKKWWFIAIVVVIIVGSFGSKKEDEEPSKKKEVATTEKSTTKSSSVKEEQIPESSSTTTESSESTKETFKKKKIKLDNVESFQFVGANIKPLKIETDKKGKMTFYFDWRNDQANETKTSFNGASLIIQAFQNGEELNSNYEEMLENQDNNLFFKTDKNVTLTVDFKFELIDPISEIEIKISSLDGQEEKFTVTLD